MNPHPRHLILFDGMCGLCSRAVQFVLTRDRSGIFAFASLQSEIGRRFAGAAGSAADSLSTFVLVERYGTPDERVLIRSRAALFVSGQLGFPWSMARAFGLLPTALIDWAYDLVAANRYRLFRQRAQCFMPRPEDRDRFLDSSTK